MKVNISISTGNSKTEIPSFNTLPGAFYHEYDGYRPAEYKGDRVCGTCSVDCPGCYAKKLCRYPAVYKAYLNNTLAAINDDLTPLENYINVWLDLNWPRVFRWHDSGDIVSINYLNMMVRIALNHPDIRFYTYTKRFDILATYTGEIPDNLIINLSPWEGITDPDLFNKLLQSGKYGVFMYDSSRSLDGVHCPAANKDGTRNKKISCLHCGRCWKSKNNTAVYPH